MAGLYIHIPFCRSKCAYCDFFSTPKSNADQAAYVSALLREFDERKFEINEPLKTVYIGGGTPSFLKRQNLELLLNGLAERLVESGIEEFTVEANPEDINNDFLGLSKDYGVNRISIGIQSFNDAVLNAISRSNTRLQAIAALDMLANANWNFSADLIFGLPFQDIALWKNDLETLLHFRPPHFSSYLLSLEKGTRLWAMSQVGKFQEADDETVSEMYKILLDKSAFYGYTHYEISNYAMPGFKSKHNSAYWDSTPYLGLGAAAYSFDGQRRRYNPSNLNEYLSEITSGRSAFQVEEESAIDRLNDYIFTSLRTAEGIDVNVIEHVFPEYAAKLIHTFENSKILTAREGRYAIPERKWLVSDAIIRDLLV